MVRVKNSNTMTKKNLHNYHFRNLVFEGGGVKGIAYVGALEVLEKEGILQNIERVAGTSAGAMVAVLVGLGYSASELKDILWKINFKNFMDSSWGVVRDTKRLLTDYGWYKGDFFRNLMGGYVKEKTGNSEATFKDLEQLRKKGKPFRELTLVGCDLTTGYAKVFSATTTPDAKIADAARISMSIPLFFAAVKGINGNDHIYVDGGLLDNYSVKTYDQIGFVADKNNARRTEYYEKINEKLRAKNLRTRSNVKPNEYVYNKETLGFRLDAKEDIETYLNQSNPPTKEIKSFFTYTKALVTALIDAQNNVHLHSDDWQRTVYIDTLGIGATDFDISDSKKTKLVESGTLYTEAYLEWYNNDEEKANK